MLIACKQKKESNGYEIREDESGVTFINKKLLQSEIIYQFTVKDIYGDNFYFLALSGKKDTDCQYG